MDANTTRIKVNSYDMEWYAKDGQLIKFDNTKAKFYLTWGDTPSSVASPYSNVGGSYKVSKGYIDLVGLNKENAGDADTIDAKEIIHMLILIPTDYLLSIIVWTQ